MSIAILLSQPLAILYQKNYSGDSHSYIVPSREVPTATMEVP